MATRGHALLKHKADSMFIALRRGHSSLLALKIPTPLQGAEEDSDNGSQWGASSDIKIGGGASMVEAFARAHRSLITLTCAEPRSLGWHAQQLALLSASVLPIDQRAMNEDALVSKNVTLLGHLEGRVRKDFTALLQLIQECAQRQSALVHIYKQWRDASRRAKSLEHVAIPRETSAIVSIGESVEETEREDRGRIRRTMARQ